jgi:FAD:protein FMN transferase
VTVIDEQPGSRRRHVERVMGTVVSFDVRSAVPDRAVTDACNWLHTVDTVFSTYQPDSEICRLGRGELRLEHCRPEVAEVLGLCDNYRQLSDGYFSVTAHGVLDPSAVVKGWAVEAASTILVRAGSQRHAICGGGDLQLVGAPGDPPWQVGIVDPFDPTRVLAVLSITAGAVATSGITQRGPHVINPRTGQPATDLASVTVVGDRLTHADALATAALAMGHHAKEWLNCLPDVEAHAVTADGRQWATRNFPVSHLTPWRSVLRRRQGRPGLNQGLQAGEDGRPPIGDADKDVAAASEAVVHDRQLDHALPGFLDVEGDLGAGLSLPGGGRGVVHADLGGPLWREGVPGIGQASRGI